MQATEEMKERKKEDVRKKKRRTKEWVMPRTSRGQTALITAVPDSRD